MNDVIKKLSYRTNALVSNTGNSWTRRTIVYIEGDLSALDISGVWWSYTKDIEEGEFEIQ